jgi:hypothetical protein
VGFVVFFFAAWLAVFVFCTMVKSLSPIENTFIFLVVLILYINVAWIVIDELKYIRVAADGLNYTAYLIYRTLLVPTIFVILFNVFYRRRSIEYGLLAAVLCIGAVLALNGLARGYGILAYKRWNIIYDGVLLVFLQIGMFYVHRMFRRACVREARQP